MLLSFQYNRESEKKDIKPGDPDDLDPELIAKLGKIAILHKQINSRHVFLKTSVLVQKHNMVASTVIIL